MLSAADGELGIEFARAYRPEVILMTSPAGIGGVEAMKILRADPSTRTSDRRAQRQRGPATSRKLSGRVLRIFTNQSGRRIHEHAEHCAGTFEPGTRREQAGRHV